MPWYFLKYHTNTMIDVKVLYGTASALRALGTVVLTVVGRTSFLKCFHHQFSIFFLQFPFMWSFCTSTPFGTPFYAFLNRICFLLPFCPYFLSPLLVYTIHRSYDGRLSFGPSDPTTIFFPPSSVLLITLPLITVRSSSLPRGLTPILNGSVLNGRRGENHCYQFHRLYVTTDVNNYSEL